MDNYSKPLEKKEWSNLYNLNILNDVINTINNKTVSVWSKELLKICGKNKSCLEIGCGTGISSLWLAYNGISVTAVDYSESSVELVKAAADKLNLDNINVILFDATKDLPFKDKQFDFAFQAGLLEHFNTEKQIELLRLWKKYCKTMISMIPNASSIPYRVGKKIMEDNGSWEYGMEIPKHSLAKEFTLAGIKVEKEYTIGVEWAQYFLPKKHYIRDFFNLLEKDGFDLADMMQGYLLVTIGNC